jgi:hypothetical protein
MVPSMAWMMLLLATVTATCASDLGRQVHLPHQSVDSHCDFVDIHREPFALHLDFPTVFRPSFVDGQWLVLGVLPIVENIGMCASSHTLIGTTIPCGNPTEFEQPTQLSSLSR